jgi:hypothetical protein
MLCDKPYLEKVVIEKVWNPQYSQQAICVCGHAYERHFDGYDDMANIGCKYCGCNDFVSIEVNKKAAQ